MNNQMLETKLIIADQVKELLELAQRSLNRNHHRQYQTYIKYARALCSEYDIDEAFLHSLDLSTKVGNIVEKERVYA